LTDKTHIKQIEATKVPINNSMATPR